MDFDTWLQLANAIVVARTGMDRESFPDWDWWNAFDDGLSFSEAVEDFLEELYLGAL